MLTRHFLAASSRPGLDLTGATVAALGGHTWPGNVRELKNVIDRGVALSRAGHLVIDSVGGPRRDSAGNPGDDRAPAFRTSSGDRKPFRDAKAEAFEAFERAYLADLMGEHDTLAAAAQAAQMDRKHLRATLRRLGMID